MIDSKVGKAFYSLMKGRIVQVLESKGWLCRLCLRQHNFWSRKCRKENYVRVEPGVNKTCLTNLIEDNFIYLRPRQEKREGIVILF